MQQFNEEIAKQIGQISTLAVNQSLESAEKRFEEFKEKIEKKAFALFSTRPVLEIRINEGDFKKVKGRISPVLSRMVANSQLGLYTMLVGPAGCGKTTAAAQLSEALGVQFGSVCLTAGASETWLFGRQTPVGFVEGMFSKIYKEGGVFLADEMDAADANLLLSINTALSHDSMLNPMSGEVIKKHKDFTFIGAANTNGKGANHLYTGRSRLDAATLDRMVILVVDYDSQLEKELCPDEELYNFLFNVRASLRAENYDEFLSTRAFVSCYKQVNAGIPVKDVKDSLIANWGEAAQNIANKHFKESELSKKPKGKPKKQPIEEVVEYKDLKEAEVFKW